MRALELDVDHGQRKVMRIGAFGFALVRMEKRLSVGA